MNVMLNNNKGHGSMWAINRIKQVCNNNNDMDMEMDICGMTEYANRTVFWK